MVGLAGIEPRGHCAAPTEKAGKQPGRQTVWKQCCEEHLGHSAEIINSSWISLRGSIHRDTSPGTLKRAGWSLPLTLAPQHKHRATCRKKHSTDSGHLTCLQQALTLCTLPGLPFSVTLASIPPVDPLPQKTIPNPCQHLS